MAYHAILVKDGVAYENWGKVLAPVLGKDGYYVHPSDARIERDKSGRLLLEKVNPLTVYSEGVTVTDYPMFVLDKSTSESPENWGEVSNVPVGSKVIALRQEKYSSFLYFPVSEPDDLSEVLAEWWLKFSSKSPWLGGKTDSRGHALLDPKRNISLKSYKNRAPYVATMQDCGTFLNKPGNLEIKTATHLKRSLTMYKKFLSKQISPIGGVVTHILPAWQQGIALCWIKFELNGVDPTRGVGCLVYKSGDFFFGPWCQAPAQVGSRYGTDMIHYYPPVYTLRSWILGPLQDALSRQTLKGGRSHGPADFEINSKVVIAGRASKDDADGTLKTYSARQYEEAAALAVNDKRNNSDKYEIKLVAGNIRFRLEAGKAESVEPMFKIPLIFYRVSELRHAYLVSGDCSRWRYRAVFSSPRDIRDEKNLLFPFIQEVDVDLLARWGVPSNVVFGSTGLDHYCRHNQFPQLDCDCTTCRDIRMEAQSQFKTLGLSWPERV